jgi:hypothetical protein
VVRAAKNNQKSRKYGALNGQKIMGQLFLGSFYWHYLGGRLMGQGRNNKICVGRKRKYWLDIKPKFSQFV